MFCFEVLSDDEPSQYEDYLLRAGSELSFVNTSSVIVIMQFQVTIATKCRALTR
jgi:hypothetical protein